MLSAVNAFMTLQMLFPRELLCTFSTMVWRFTSMRPSVALKVLLSREVLATVHAVMGSFWLYALMKLDVSV